MNDILELAFFLLGILLTSVFIYEFGRILIAGIVAVKTGRKTVRASRPLFDADVRILIAGDSTAVGVGCSHPCFSIAGRIMDDFPEAHVENIAVNGISTKLLSDKLELLLQQPELRSYYDVVIIHTGGMDTISLIPIGRYEKTLTRCLKLAKKLGAEVILVSPPNVGSSPLMRFLPLKIWYTRRSRKIHETTLKVVRACGIQHVDLFTEEDKNPLKSKEKTLYARDFSHPNDEGYGIWYKPIKHILHTTLKNS